MVIVNAGGGGHFGQDPCARQCDSYPIDEIIALARAQVGGGGESAVSLNAIARTMRTSPAALYRYFDNRDDLVAELVVDAYLDLAAHLEAAGSGVGAEQVRAVARAFRAWALASPNTYRLVFESVSGSGLALAADRIRPAAQRSMDVFLRALAGIGLEGDGEVGDELSAQLVAWGERAEHPDLPLAVLHRGVVAWTRLHGLVSLEIGHHLAATGVDPALLFEAELTDLLRVVSGPGVSGGTHG